MKVLKIIKNFLFEQKHTQTLIIRLAAIIMGILLAVSVLGFISPAIFGYVIPIVLVITIVLSALLLFFLLQFIQGIRLIDKNAVTLAQGNLNINDIISEKTKGLEILASSFNDMKRNLLSYIESTKSNVIILSDAVDKVTKSIDMTYKGNEQIASNITIVAEKSQEQLEIARNTLEGIEKVRLGSTRINTTLGNIEGFVENTVKLTTDGADHVNKYADQIQLISSNLDETSSVIKTLNSNLSEITGISNLIVEITGQLNLLSLNSRVEAARAGEAGKGFAVVAMEMNKLSDATKDSVKKINNLLSDITKSNKKVGESIGNVMTSFDTSKEIFDSMKDTFYTINNNANVLNSEIKNVYAESVMINDSTKVISEQGVVLHDASNEINNITQDVAAVTQESLAENEEINEQAISLKKMLSSIESLLKRYRTSISPVEQVSAKRLRFVLLSPQSDPFWLSVKQGALYAQNELKDKNVTVEFMGFEKADQTMIDTLNKIVEAGCDGIILPGFIKGIESCVQKAAAKKIPIMTFHTDFEDTAKRVSYFGPDIQAEGALAAELLAKSIDQEGKIVIFRGKTSSATNVTRRDAAVAKLAKYSGIKIASEIDEIEDTSSVYKKLKEYLYYSPDIRSILMVGEGAQGAARVIEEMGLVGKLQLFCFNYSTEMISLVKKGIVHMVFRQDGFSQGHDPIIYLYNYIVANEVPMSTTYTRTEVIDQYSVSE